MMSVHTHWCTLSVSADPQKTRHRARQTQEKREEDKRESQESILVSRDTTRRDTTRRDTRLKSLSWCHETCVLVCCDTCLVVSCLLCRLLCPSVCLGVLQHMSRGVVTCRVLSAAFCVSVSVVSVKLCVRVVLRDTFVLISRGLVVLSRTLVLSCAVCLHRCACVDACDAHESRIAVMSYLAAPVCISVRMSVCPYVCPCVGPAVCRLCPCLVATHLIVLRHTASAQEFVNCTLFACGPSTLSSNSFFFPSFLSQPQSVAQSLSQPHFDCLSGYFLGLMYHLIG